MVERNLLVLSGGHPYEEAPFAALLGRLAGWRVNHLVHPEAEQAVAAGAADHADAVLFYDMPGYEFADGSARSRPPSPEFTAAILHRLESGRGIVLMHHALAGWAEWPEWAEIAGGRFLYAPGPVRGEARLDSGYRHDVIYTAEVVADHPVTSGLPATFEVCDELYLAEIFDDEVIPLVRARYDFDAAIFYSAAHAVAGRMFDNRNWPHPPGSNLVAWARMHGRARVVYLQFGDGPPSYENPQVLHLLTNALDWTAQEAV